MRLLVTGASGFVGRELLARLPEGVEAVAVARSTPAWGSSLPSVEWIAADVAAPSFQRALPHDVDAVIHLAQSRFDRQFPRGADDVVDVNVAAAVRLLDLAQASGASRFVLASSATVYRRDPAPLVEESPLDLSSFYAASKRAAELLAFAYSSLTPVSVLRLFTTYGSGQRGRLIADLTERVNEGRVITVEGSRGLVLSPIHVSDVAEALLMACATAGPDYELVNVGGAEALGIAELAAKIGTVVDRAPVLEHVGGEEPGGLVADRGRMLGRFPELQPLTFDEGLRLTIESHSRA